ncbi:MULTISPECIES: 16S rRNA (cytosine(967)-C(5))-methyltransferase [Fischerella]|uniref:16S rRNA (cytosine(967)-C(5))-methyltransferase n=1 Tax=Fischerella TaxID=1190 RepID=UPI0002F8AEF7|nr:MULTISPECIES: 16S rRNA (cytosine(967)-C(5))-methyltransferase [Fischerella]MBD2430092.1 16S rRNA (cytosine(967)-C(5))-methyltransferase [Fischerella sp. FACHB-380]
MQHQKSRNQNISPRQLAFIALREVHKGAYADVALDRVLAKSDIVEGEVGAKILSDRRLVTELVYGCTRRQRTLDAIIDQLAKKKSHQQPKDLRTILHLGLYQLLYQERVPPSAAVNTTVQLAKDNGFAGLAGFVNGLLRQFLRVMEEEVGRWGGGETGNIDEILSASPGLSFLTSFLQLPENPVERLGILHSFPDWIIQVWIDQFGVMETEKLCIWMNQTPAIDLRVNPLRADLETVEAALQAAGVSCQRLPHLPQALRLLSHPGQIQNLPGFSQGWWSVQDSSAQLVGHFLDPQPKEVVIDTCAAPGGKTTHIAELMQDTGKIWACDRTASRMRKLQENMQRLYFKSIEICIGDSRNLSQFRNSANRVLLDAPCSGLGTLHRHADVRWRQTPDSVKELSILQKELLSHTSTFVKEEGVLVYATCTLHPAENESVIESFLTDNSDWKIETPCQNVSFHRYSTSQGWVKVLPHQHDMDGFFMVRLRKTNNSG